MEFTKKDNIKTLHSIDIGFAAASATKNVSSLENLKFREECCIYLQHVCTKLIAKCPLKYPLVKGATCLDPEVMLSAELRKSRIETALEVFINKKRLIASDADVISRDYVELCNRTSVKGKLKEFRRDVDRLDTVLTDILDKEKADIRLITFVQQILSIFHGNAAVERSFSINKECLIENLHEDSLVAQRIVYDAVSAAGGVSHVQVTKAMIHSVRNASAMRVEAAKKMVAAEEAEANKRKRICDEIKLLQSKKARIENSAKEESNALKGQLMKLHNSLKE